MTKHYFNKLFLNKNMFPSQSMDYVGNVHNLFSKIKTTDDDTTFNYPQSPLQSALVNRSSSSADSISPESYFDNSIYNCQTSDRFHARARSITPKHVYETPKLSYENLSQTNQQYQSFTNIYEPLDSSLHNLDTSTSIYEPFTPTYESANLRHIFNTQQPIRRQQAIIGRKILGRNSQIKHEIKIDEEELENSWQMDSLGQTPPGRQRSYELFPSERGFQFSSPVKPINGSPSFNENIKNLSPMTNQSPTYAPKMTNTLNWSPSQIVTTPFQPTLSNIPSGLNEDIGQSKMCTFCRKNGETPVVYMTHCVKEKRGNTYIVTCPILRSHVCSICGSSGDNAHTITYCPILRRNNDGKPLKSTTITLKNTRIKSNGRRRY